MHDFPTLLKDAVNTWPTLELSLHKLLLSLLHVSGRNSLIKDGFLTQAELDYWSEHFKVDNKLAAVRLPEPEFLLGKCGEVSCLL